MKKKKKIKSEIKTSQSCANQENMNFTQKILSKYGVGKLKIQFSTLIFRQYRRMLFNNTTKEIDQIDTKSNKGLPPIPFNIFRNIKCNSQNFSPVIRCYTVEAKHQGFSRVSMINKSTVVNLFNQIYEKYNKTLSKKVDTDRNELQGRENAETKWMELQQRQVFIEGVNKITQIVSEPSLLLKPQTAKNQLKTLDVQDQFKNKQHFSSFTNSQRQGSDLLYENPQSELKALTPQFSKTITFEQKFLHNNAINVTTNGTTSRINYGTNNGITNETNNRIINGTSNRITNETINKITYGTNNRINNETINKITYGTKNRINNETNNRITNGIIDTTTNIPVNRITNILEKSAINNRSTQFPLEDSTKEDTVLHNEKKSNVLRTVSNVEEKPPENEKLSEDEKQNFKQNELILHTSMAKKGFTPKTQGFIKNALVQADGAISRIFKNLSKKQNATNLENGFFKKNIYQSSPELIPAEITTDRQAREKSKLKEKLQLKRLIDKHEDNSSLILYKPHIKETAAMTGQTLKDVLISDKEVCAKAVTSSKPHKEITDLGTEDVNLLAERVLKVIEKRIAIQKDRRGLR